MGWFNNLSVAKRFVITGFVVVTLVLALASIGVWGAVQFENFLSTIQEDQIPEILNDANITELVHSIRFETFSAVAQTATASDYSLSSIEQQVNSVVAKVKIYTDGTHPEEEQKVVSQVGQATAIWHGQMQQLLPLLKANTPQSRQQAQTLFAQIHFDELLDLLTPLLTQNNEEIKNIQKKSAETSQTVIEAIIGFCVVILLIICLGLTLLARSIVRMTGELQRLNGEVNTSFNNLEDKRRIGQQTSSRLKAMTAELNATSAQQFDGSQQQASALDEITILLGELTGSANQIAQKATNINQVAEQMRDFTTLVKSTTLTAQQVGEQGQQAMKEVINTNGQVYNLYEQQAKLLNTLAEQSGDIEEIVSLMRNISDETHLLALNAAIEAAGAGEYGERFGVVASAVKELSNRSLTASREIQTILSKLQQHIKSAVTTVGTGQQITRSALEVAQETGRVIEELAGAIRHSAVEANRIEQVSASLNTLTEEIRLASSQQSKASAQTVETLQEVGIIAQQNASGSKQVNLTVQELEELANELNLALTT